MKTTIAVKELANFVCQSGNLTSELFSTYDLLKGKKAHEYLQSKYNEKSFKEVYVKKEVTYLNNEYILHGFIDGVLNINDEIIIEEIKSTIKDLTELNINSNREYLAQLKIYGYLYMLCNGLDSIHLRLTYISAVDFETLSFDIIESLDSLEDFTFDVLEKYIDFLNMLKESQVVKEETIKTVKFPFVMRDGQRQLMKAVYQVMNKKGILYAIAPTGIGKTMATMFAALKTLKSNDKLFYLTAKGSGKNAPIEAINILKQKGLKIKAIDITAKRKICNAKLKNCNPEECPYAIGYYDRLKEATLEIFKNYDVYDRETILNISNKRKICAFEFSLYLSYFCDIVIADYNYVFDPKAHLIRYFEDDTYKPKVLVDEAHNLISRSKKMYSCSINEIDIRTLRSHLNGYKPSLRNECNKALEIINGYREFLKEKTLYTSDVPDLNLNSCLKNIALKCDQIFADNKKIPNKDEIMDAYFKILDFNRIADLFGTYHKELVYLKDDIVNIDYYCLDASTFLLKTINESIEAIVFFSATMYPIDYHINLLTKGEGEFLQLQSPFDPNNLDIIINNKISTKYKDRANSIDTIIETIEIVCENHPGNYIVFFPSYQYLKMVVDCMNDFKYDYIIQANNMSEDDRDMVIEKFTNSKKTLVGFFVMGGLFSEGIDFIGEALSGVIIVGVGLPMICDENNILKDYFDNLYQQGFDYAYTYPGFTKVIQAVGRVIRSETDKGIAILLDNRFLYNRYTSLMPIHWQNIKVINNIYDLKKELISFYKKKPTINKSSEK